MMTRIVAVVAALAACAGTQRTDDDDAQRIATLEQKLAAQEQQVDQLRALIATPHASSPDDEAKRLRLLEAKVDDLAAQAIAARAATTPPPPHHVGPDPSKLYAVRVGGAPQDGPANAKVTLITTSDYACPYCERIRTTLDDLRKKYGNDLRVVHESFVVHKGQSLDVTPHAVAACAANKQKKWRAMDDALWDEAFKARAFDAATLDTIAEHAKLDMKRYHADIPACEKEIADENAAMQKLGVGAIPTTYINGHVLTGAMPIENFEALIDQALADANASIARGVKQDRYYDQEIVGKGTDTP
jgi:protein-disulfide isomerase|nr:thioredoxin domain-containing protein [Kofleriaceae bacterium]